MEDYRGFNDEECFMMRRFRTGTFHKKFKPEIRISKFETNPNIKSPNVLNVEAFDHYR